MLEARSPSSPTGRDVEKGTAAPLQGSRSPSLAIPATSNISPEPSRLSKYISPAIFEERGIERVLPSEASAYTWKSGFQTISLWVSINLAAVCVTLGMLAPTVFGLGFTDACLCAVFGSFLGSVPVSYMVTWGPKGGLRTMVFSRFVMGWYPQKLVVLLQLVIMIGYSMINCVIAGQILSAVSPNNSLSIVVGIIIVAILSWLITIFGIRVFNYYERYAFLPQLIVLSILYGLSAKNFDTSSVSQGDSRTVAGSRLSFFSLCLSAAITYAGVGPDYFVYYKPNSPSSKLFILSLVGLTTSFAFAIILGIGLASGIASNPSYASAYEVSQGALIVEGYRPVGAFGHFCGVVVALGTIANLIPTTYSTGIDAQLLAGVASKIPRWAWNTVGAIVYTACALAGRAHLSEIFTNFLALMGYWTAIWIAIILEEHLIFRRTRGWDWDIWDQKEKLPLGIAALAAFLTGWVGAILGMAQVYYNGPIARLVGEYGADMGNYIGFSWALLVYPPLRWAELHYIGK